MNAARLLAENDGVRWRSSEACRLGVKRDDLLLTTEDCAQAASEAAARTTANNRMARRETADAANGASEWPASLSTLEAPAQAMEDISYPQSAPPTKIEIQTAIRAGFNQGEFAATHGINRAISSECGDFATASGARGSGQQMGWVGETKRMSLAKMMAFAKRSTRPAFYRCGPESEISRSARKTFP
jgi:hypothetical protein